MVKIMTKNELFLKLANPDENGISRWVLVDEFIGEYAPLKLGNGASWCRKESSIAKAYNVEFRKNKGNTIDAIRLNGFNNKSYSQHIRADIKREIKKMRCVILGTSNPEVDHKNGRKNEDRVMLNINQKISDFQPLSKAANDAKRQYCKECNNSNQRYDAKKLGYPISFYKGSIEYDNINGCIGCFWYDPIEFRKHLKAIEK